MFFLSLLSLEKLWGILGKTQDKPKPKLQDWYVYSHEEVTLLLKSRMVTSTHRQTQRVNRPWLSSLQARISPGPDQA